MVLREWGSGERDDDRDSQGQGLKTLPYQGMKAHNVATTTS
jgi:hypothetical protein